MCPNGPVSNLILHADHVVVIKNGVLFPTVTIVHMLEHRHEMFIILSYLSDVPQYHATVATSLSHRV